ncbi:MAG: hypothetical protein GYA21_15640 [Myxococcales bacterium]|nr:hypothetical protein [Myxococcales bacterium]
MMMQLDAQGRSLQAATLVALTLLSGPARADNLGGLGFLLIVWPLGIICFLALLVLAIGGIVKACRGRMTRRFAAALLWIGAGLGIAFAAATLWLNSIFSLPAAAELVALTLAPVELLSAFVAIFGLVWRARLPRPNARPT